MYVIHVRNVQEALPIGIQYLVEHGVRRDSRNGSVLVSPEPVTTVYEKPIERVLFWEERDANPFFHLYESLWMLRGRNDIKAVARYAKHMMSYSDDGITMHGAYGHRWRYETDILPRICTFDQLKVIATRLREMPDDRRSVLQMWDAEWDLRTVNESKDVPCNTTATFQINHEGALDLCVFCRSNDIIWGAYGANAVHFTILLEYMANWIKRPVGKFYQVSVNYHAYENVLTGVKLLTDEIRPDGTVFNPYVEGLRVPVEMSDRTGIMQDPMVYPEEMRGSQDDVDGIIRDLVAFADADTFRTISATFGRPNISGYKWANVWWTMLEAHEAYRNTSEDGSHYRDALEILYQGPQQCDWIHAGVGWMERRLQAWSQRQFDKEVRDFNK